MVNVRQLACGFLIWFMVFRSFPATVQFGRQPLRKSTWRFYFVLCAPTPLFSTRLEGCLLALNFSWWDYFVCLMKNVMKEAHTILFYNIGSEVRFSWKFGKSCWTYVFDIYFIYEVIFSSEWRHIYVSMICVYTFVLEYGRVVILFFYWRLSSNFICTSRLKTGRTTLWYPRTLKVNRFIHSKERSLGNKPRTFREI